MRSYLVGGYVRDWLLKRPSRDRDWVVVGATPDAMLALGFRQVGREFPVFLHPETREEHALARDGQGGFGFGITLEQDLRHRDFTINAMALDEDGGLVDPVGGAADLEAGIIRHIGESLTADPLRILRAARCAAHFGFSVASETLAEMGRLAAAGALSEVAPERVWAELLKALSAENPSRFFLVLRAAGALSVLFPEIDRLFGIPQRADDHPEIDTGVHAMMVLECAARLTPDPSIRFAALIHDLGKGTTPAESWPRHYGHEERGPGQVEALVRRYAGPNLFIELGTMAARLHGRLHRVSELRPRTILDVLEAADAFHRPERLEALLIVGEADRRGRLGYGNILYPQAAMWRRARDAAAAVTARDLLADGQAPGPELASKLFQRRVAAIRAALSDDGQRQRVTTGGAVAFPDRLRISDALADIEREEGVTLLFAIESGSRAWGFPSRDSDYDVRFVYVRPLDWYLSLSRQRDVIERPIVGDLDINGWDIRKALALLNKGHPVLLEWLCSPIVYLERPETALLRAFAARTDHRQAALYHYASLVRRFWQEHIKDRDQVVLKKYFYGLRPAAALCWLRTHPVGRVPMDLPSLLADIAVNSALKAEIDDLQCAKAAASELGMGARRSAIDTFIVGELDLITSVPGSPFQAHSSLRADVDDLFRDIARRFSAGRRG